MGGKWLAMPGIFPYFPHMKLTRNTVPVYFLLIGAFFLFTHFAVESKEGATSPAAPEGYNLALREVIHALLLKQQDSTTTIPPIIELGEGRYSLRMESIVKYGLIKAEADRVFARHQMPLTYRLAVHDCATHKLILGYLATPDSLSDTFPCEGRVESLSCSVLIFTLGEEHMPQKSSFPLSLAGGIGMFLLAIGFVVFEKRKVIEAVFSKEEKPSTSSQFLREKRQLTIGSHTHQLTEQETKLLAYLYDHPNEDLARKQILGNVWESGDVMITRTLDVFISRLRKMLEADPYINIITVRGHGYRMERPA